MNQKLSRIRNRDGISIIEVLTSMAVATIGVFGVMVMIPFAVRQSQTGLNNDAASSLGRNAVEEMQVQGYLIADSDGVLTRISGLSADSSLIHFDPIGAAPPASLGDEMIGGIMMDRVSGIDLAAAEDAVALCRGADDLQFATPETDGGDGLTLPQSILNEDGTRQSLGRISWSMFLVPEKAAGQTGHDKSNQPIDIHRFRTFTLVYESRFPELYSAAVDPEKTQDNIYDVNEPAAATAKFADPVTQIELELETGETMLDSGIGRDSWILLVNQIPSSGTEFQIAYAPYNAQVMFARVTRVDDNVVTVDGGPFYFHEDTQMIHLQGVTNVFERSVAIED